MTTKKNRRVGFIMLLLVTAFSITSCKANADVAKRNLPTEYGFYIVEDASVKKIEPFDYYEQNLTEAVFVNNQKPEFVIYDQNFDDLDRLRLFDYRGLEIPFISEEISNPDKNAYQPMFHLTISGQLENSYYCFTDHYFVNPYIEDDKYRNMYCFGQGSPERLGITIVQKEYQIPEIEGFFIEGSEAIHPLTPISLQDEIDVNTLPVSNQLMPTVFLRSTSIDPEDVKIIWYPATIGINIIDHSKIKEVFEDQGANLAGIQEDDVITMVNDVDVTKWNDEYSSTQDSYYLDSFLASSCKVGSSIDVTITRGTQLIAASPNCQLQEVFRAGFHPYSIFGYKDPLSVSYRIEQLNYYINPNGYALFKPPFPLLSGNVYCIQYAGESPRFCFMVR